MLTLSLSFVVERLQAFINNVDTATIVVDIVIDVDDDVIAKIIITDRIAVFAKRHSKADGSDVVVVVARGIIQHEHR